MRDEMAVLVQLCIAAPSPSLPLPLALSCHLAVRLNFASLSPLKPTHPTPLSTPVSIR